MIIFTLDPLKWKQDILILLETVRSVYRKIQTFRENRGHFNPFMTIFQFKNKVFDIFFAKFKLINFTMDV